MFLVCMLDNKMNSMHCLEEDSQIAKGYLSFVLQKIKGKSKFVLHPWLETHAWRDVFLIGRGLKVSKVSEYAIKLLKGFNRLLLSLSSYNVIICHEALLEVLIVPSIAQSTMIRPLRRREHPATWTVHTFNCIIVKSEVISFLLSLLRDKLRGEGA